jgi:murein DD-endopeptidase MepM/ murein hydrolase activator NlpD
VGTRDGRVSQPTRIRVAPIPVVSRWRCIAQCGTAGGARGGSLLLLRGVRLGRVDRAVFLGRRGRGDDRPARVSDASFESVRLRVPATGVSGSLTVGDASGASSPRRAIRVLPSAFFPVKGPHTYGGSGAQFGAGRGGRSHQGQDVFASCGTPLVAVRGGRVRYAGYQSSAGNYVVIDGSSPNWDYAYMHLQSPSRYAAGRRVAAGARLGEVGESGNAHGCHLHFELWSAPGWYVGGRPFDPLPHLRAWDRARVAAQARASSP